MRLYNKFLHDKLQEMTRIAAVEREEEHMPVTERVASGTHATGGQSASEDLEFLRDVVQGLRTGLRELRLEVSQMKAGSPWSPEMTPVSRATPPRVTQVRGLVERGPLCWTCRQYGHMARECPEQMKSERM